MTLLNLTPHAITLAGPSGIPTVIQPHAPKGQEARVNNTPGTLVQIEGVPVPVMTADIKGDIIGLPEPVEGVLLIVSGIVGDALIGKGRKDVLVLGTFPKDEAIRNSLNQVIGVTRLKMIA